MLPSTPEDARAFLFSLPPSHIRLGLTPVKTALAALGNPEQRFMAFHVAGTNGKGSTCAFADSILRAQGYRVGLYTSPHLVRFNERISVNGREISDEVLGERILEVLGLYPDACLQPPPLTYFELGTVVAFWHFSQEAVDLAVLETGLGGRLDATSAARAAATAITPISFDHMELLGNTLSAIASEKAGIFRPQTSAVSSRQSTEALEILKKRAQELNCPLFIEGHDFALEPSGEDMWNWRGRKQTLNGLCLGLRGSHQGQNAAVALAGLELLSDEGFQISTDSIRAGLANVTWPGRLEEVLQNPTVLLDGAHNPAAMSVLQNSLDALYPGRRLRGVFGVLADKDHRPMLELLFPHLESVFLCPLPSPRSLKPDQYLADAKRFCPRVEICASVEQALRMARVAATGDDLVLVTGSLLLVGEATALLSSLR